MRHAMKDEDIEYGFNMAEGLGVKGNATSTTLSMAKRIAPIADKHKLLVGHHGHDATNNPNAMDTLTACVMINGRKMLVRTAAAPFAASFLFWRRLRKLKTSR
jgi:hypothetical protein